MDGEGRPKSYWLPLLYLSKKKRKGIREKGAWGGGEMRFGEFELLYIILTMDFSYSPQKCVY
ncbi:hypothetical protein BSAF29S_04520 [Bacillus safensis subsp. safensis]